MPIPKPGSLVTENRHDTVCQFPNLDRWLPKSVTTQYANSHTWIVVYRKASRHSMPVPKPGSLVTEKFHVTVSSVPKLERRLPNSISIQYCIFAKRKRCLPKSFKTQYYIFAKRKRHLPKSVAIQYCIFAKRKRCLPEGFTMATDSTVSFNKTAYQNKF